MFLCRGGYEVVVTAILKRVPLTIDRSDNSEQQYVVINDYFNTW